MKTLYILTSDGGDGSRGIHYTMNKAFIDRLQEKYVNDEMDYDSLGVDGDGFGYSTLTLPDECSLESLGIRYDVAVDYAEMMDESDEDEE